MLNLNNVITGKVRSMKLSDYFEYRKCEYVYLQLIVTKSNRNTNTEQIAILINKMFKKTNKYISQASKKLIIEERPKASFYIHITKDKVQFYFMIPKIHTNQFKTKFKEIWKNVEIKEVDNIPIDINSCSKFDLHYKYDDSLSLAVDKRSNDLLNANMTIVNMLEENEELGIFYNFIPTSERESNYFHSNSYKNTVKRYENGENLKKSKNIKDYSIIVLKNLIDFINDLLNLVLKTSNNSHKVTNPIKREISNNTKIKGEKAICKNQTIILAKSDKKDREIELSNTLANTFKSISDNNELIANEITKNIDIKRTIINNVSVNKSTIEEDSNFINMPSTDVIKQFNMIEHNKVLELKAPKCLEKGEVRIGTVKEKDSKKEVYYSMDEQIKRMSRVLLGSQGAGKDYYMVNLAKDIISANKGLIVIDYIDKCQLADNIKAIAPKNKLIEINCNDSNQLQSFVYNELSYKNTDDIYTKVEVSMQKAQQYESLLDSINDVSSQLTPRMLRYLYCAGTLAFFYNINSSFKDVVNLLKYPALRDELLNNMNEEARGVLSDEIEDIKDLDKTDKKGNVENYDSKVDGILDRIARLKSASLYTKIAYSNAGTSNIDFIKAMNERKVILIKIPHKSFKSKMLKDLMCTFYLSKIWLAKQDSDEKIQTEVFINEIHQSYHSQLMFEDIMVEHRKYNITFTFAMHYLDQLTKKAKSSLLSSGASFLLISGCEGQAFNELSTYFEKDGYSKVDLAELERYHALCLIKNEENNYSSFICKLPG